MRNQKKHWFWSSLGYSKSLFIDVLLASFLLNLFMLATPLFTMNVYDRVVPNLAFDTLWVFVSAIVLVYFFDLLIKSARTYTLGVLTQKSDVLVSSALFEHILKIKLSHNKLSIGEMLNRVKEFEYIRSFLTASSLVALIDMPFVFLFLGVIFLIGGQIVFVPIVAGLVIIFYGIIIAYPLRKSVEGLSQYQAQKSELLIESLSALESVKSFSLQEKQQKQWQELSSLFAHKSFRTHLFSSSIVNFSNLLMQLSTVAVLVMGVYAIEAQELSMGGLIALMMLNSRALVPLHQLSGLISNYSHAKNAYKSLNQLMKLPSDEFFLDNELSRKNIKGSIEFKEVYFKYPNASKYALERVSFSIKRGEKVAIIGANASGKSSILKLMMGLYEPERGSIFIDGVAMTQFERKALLRAMAYLPQELHFFAGTIAQNIKESVHDLSDEALILSGKLSGLETFIVSSEKGYNRQLRSGGTGLSGGEKSAIALTRVFAKSGAKILLLDEPSAGMDSNNETLVSRSIELFSTSKTLVMVSHKQALLNGVERLILLDKGKVILDDERLIVLERLKSKGLK